MDRSTSVLIVDDDAITSETFAHSLRLHGFDTHTAANGDEALRVASSRPLDAIITDLHMPATDGLGFLRRLREQPALEAVPVALVTADVFLNEADEATIRSLGATIRYKPLWIEDVLELTLQLCGEPRRHPDPPHGRQQRVPELP
jgi:CheY-like chemotaxis protein